MNDLVRRYRQAQRIPDDAPVTEEMVRRHWDLEQALARDLLQSTEQNRWEVFDRSYTRLYSELDWLNMYSGVDTGRVQSWGIADWSDLVGRPPQRVFEVGSGRGDLIRALAERGHECRAAEITRKRGSELVGARSGLTWAVTDGVHLDRFEPAGHYDVVVSDQVVEHLHPDDLATHLAAAKTILRPGGRYIFATPHRLDGPSDVSDVFGYEVAAGMHLREYTFRELHGALREAGYTSVAAVFRLPNRLRRYLPFVHPHPTTAYLRYLQLLESAIERVGDHDRRRRVAGRARLIGFRSIFVVAGT